MAPGALSGGLTLVKSLDPVVMFASAKYQYAFETKGETRIGPIDAVDVTMGYELGLNDTVAINMAVAGLFTGKATVDGLTVNQPSNLQRALRADRVAGAGAVRGALDQFRTERPGRQFRVWGDGALCVLTDHTFTSKGVSHATSADHR